MQTSEAINESAVVPYSDNSTPATNQVNYEAVRFNAMKHGILSRLAVLPHEDAGEFSDLLGALIEEHRPAGMTEQHLIEELAAIIWRKRRVLLAEGAKINKGLRSVVTGSSSLAGAAVPFVNGMPGKLTDMQDLMTATPEEVAQSQEETRHDSECTRKASAILRKGGPTAYNKALKALLPDSRDWWANYVEEGEYQPDSEGLAAFIDEHLWPLCVSMEKEALHHYAIKAQTLGEGLQPLQLTLLNRYETHLDRKFERTLAMLLKLKELRRS